jgi:FAD/FMN-containing dehydrogenase
MATRSLSIIDVDDIRPTKKLTKSPKTSKKAVAKKSTPVAKTVAPENYISAETFEKERVVLPVVRPKKTAQKTAPKKKVAAKKAVTKKTKTNEADIHAGHDHDHSHDHLPLSRIPSRPLSGKDKIAIKRHPLGHLLLEKKLREAGFRGGVSSDKKVLEKYSTDESIFHIRPQIVIQPKDRKDVETVVKIMAVETKRFTSLSLTPRAAGTGLSGGSLTDSIVIDVAPHLTKIEDAKETKDGATIVCEPGAMWRDVEKRLRRADSYIPSYTSSKDICTIGGAVANNSAGPDSLRYGHCADWVESMDVVFHDGNTYTLRPLSYKEFKTLTKEKHAYARICREIFALIEKNESIIENGRPKTQKNSAGYALWDVISTSVEEFKKGKGTFDLGRIISGSQGTVGIIVGLTMKAIKIQKNTSLIVLPLFKLEDAPKSIMTALKYNPINIEIFDALTFDLALKNPEFFKARLQGIEYYKVLLAMYTTFHIRFGRQTPEFTILITVDEETTKKNPATEIAAQVSAPGVRARVIKNPSEVEMYLQIRRASFSLSKLLDPGKRPAAFLEDMTVPPENLGKFFLEIKSLFKEFNVKSAIHGHGGNGHFHFYPLLDFTKANTPLLIERMAERFYNAAIKFKGNICGEHNDGIIRTPHLSKLFKKPVLDLFTLTESIFDPDDIFNPGKKVNPRFDIKESIRHTN